MNRSQFVKPEDSLLSQLRGDALHYATVTWTPEDVKTLRPKWSLDRCADALFGLEGALEDAMIQRGWEVLSWELGK